jgi:hypothetical protein
MVVVLDTTQVAVIVTWTLNDPVAVAAWASLNVKNNAGNAAARRRNRLPMALRGWLDGARCMSFDTMIPFNR